MPLAPLSSFYDDGAADSAIPGEATDYSKHERSQIIWGSNQIKGVLRCSCHGGGGVQGIVGGMRKWLVCSRHGRRKGGRLGHWRSEMTYEH